MGVKYIAAELEDNATVAIVDLSDNDIEAAGGKAIAQLLVKNQSITSLNLSCKFF